MCKRENDCKQPKESKTTQTPFLNWVYTNTLSPFSYKDYRGCTEKEDVSLDKPHIYVLYGGRVRWRMISGRESGGRERNQRACSNSFGVSLAKERETDGETWRWKERQQNKKNQGIFKWKKRRLCEINKYSLLFLTHYYIQHTCMPLLSTRHKLKKSETTVVTLQALHISNRSITAVRGVSPTPAEMG